MSIQLQGNDESTFANDVTIGGDKITLSGADGAATFGGTCSLIKKDSSLPVTAEALTWGINGDPTYGGYIAYDGSATFTNTVRSGNSLNSEYGLVAYSNSDSGGSSVFARNMASGGRVFQGASSGGSTRVEIFEDGSAVFKGGVSQSNSFINLDTGGTIDVKERLQNTQAILYRLKAALIQPDADVNTLRQRLLEALDILTLEGDES